MSWMTGANSKAKSFNNLFVMLSGPMALETFSDKNNVFCYNIMHKLILYTFL